MLAVLLALTASVAFAAQPERGKRFDLAIAKGSLQSVLEQFSRQTGLQVITQLGVAESETGEVGPFAGRATAHEVMTELLNGSDLSYEWQDEYTITIFATLIRAPRAEDNVQEVLVTGTRLRNVEDGPAPIRVYGRGRIDRSGVSSLSDFSRNLTQQPFAFGAGHLQSGAQFFQMRGLGFDTTLVLINGRRLPPSANSMALNGVDINNIPLTAVERIEVMSDSASAIYGTDAIGGVVNIILKDRIEAPEVSVHYGQAKGGGTQRRAAASLGATHDRLKTTLVLDYSETAALMGEERDLWRNQDYRRYHGWDYRVRAANPGNVYSLTGQPLPGLDFFGMDGVNLYSSFSDWSITPPSRRASVYGSAQYSPSAKLSFFGEVLAANGESIALRSLPSLSRQLVPAANPFNPYGVPVAVDYLFADKDPISHIYKTDLQRVVVGARGAIHRWEWEITGLRHGEDGSSTSWGALNPSRVAAAVGSNDPQTALNLFSEGPAGSPELLESLMGSPLRYNFSFASVQWSAFIRGRIFNVGERQAEVVMGGEWRHDAAEFLESGKHVAVERSIGSAFSELRIPLLDELSLKIAARGDDYGDGEPIVNPQYGLTWRPAKDWLFRTAYSTSFRPPSFFELYMPLFQVSLPVADPLRDGEVSNVALLLGGNPDLDVVTARSFTAGFVFSPVETLDLRIGGSYWRLVMDDRIMTPSYQELLKPASPIVGRVVRDLPSIQDLQAGRAGRLRTINLTRVNFGDLQTSGIDLDASLLVEHRWGCLKFDLAVTWVDKYVSRDMSQLLPADRVGIANAQGTIPEWRTIGTLAWTYRNFGASTTATFVPSYRDMDLANGQMDRRIDSQTLVDFQTWADLDFDGNALLDESTITLGARNVFDTPPTFANAGGAYGHDISQSELTGRFIYLRVRKRF